MSLAVEEDQQSDGGLRPDTVVAGRFRVQRKLGEGGMGAVYAAVNVTTNRPVALKVMHAEYAAKKDVVRRFMREAKAATAITHPNVIEVLDVVDGEHGEPVMVMELLEGESLDSLLERRGPLGLGDVARIMTAVVSAVGAAHARGIVHRDLKPENIHLAKMPDGTIKPKVLDFGIAKILDPSQINEGDTKSGATRTGSMLGTPYYMSMEQACGEKDIDHRTDIWSLGVILYVMFTGKRPYDGDNYGQILKSLMTDTPAPVASLVGGLPAEVTEMVDRCMARQREQRPSDLREVYAVLARYCDAVSLPGPPSVSHYVPPAAGTSATLAAASVYTSSIPDTGVGASRSRRALWMVAVPVIVLLLGGSAVFLARAKASPLAAVADPTSAPSAPLVSSVPSLVPTQEPAASVQAPASSSAPSAEPRPVTAGPAIKGKPKETASKPATPDPTSPPAKPPVKGGGGIIESSPY